MFPLPGQYTWKFPARMVLTMKQPAWLVALMLAGCLLTAPAMGKGAAPIKDEVDAEAVKSIPQPPPATPTLMPVVGKNLTHVVARGEDLYTLGLQYKLAIEHLMWANGLSGTTAPVGKKLVVPTMHILPATLKEGLVINLPERGMYLFKNYEAIAFYPCAIGMGGRFATPTGEAHIVNRQMYPTWSPPEWAGVKEPVPPGPNNPLGDRWIGLSIDGVGLHGTNQPMSVGQNASHGCMRMYPSVVRILFEQVKVGMPVRIIYEPIKVGISPEDHKVYVQVYKDVYGKLSSPLETLKEKLAKTGLAQLVDEEQLKTLLANTSGLPQRLLGDDIVIKVNGQRVHTALAPFMRDGQVWACSDFLKALGAQVSYSDSDKELVISRDSQEVHFQLGRSDEAAGKSTIPDFTPRLWNGKSVVPVKPILTSLNLNFKWLPQHKTLLIYCAQLNASL